MDNILTPISQLASVSEMQPIALDGGSKLSTTDIIVLVVCAALVLYIVSKLVNKNKVCNKLCPRDKKEKFGGLLDYATGCSMSTATIKYTPVNESNGTYTLGTEMQVVINRIPETDNFASIDASGNNGSILVTNIAIVDSNVSGPCQQEISARTGTSAADMVTKSLSDTLSNQSIYALIQGTNIRAARVFAFGFAAAP